MDIKLSTGTYFNPYNNTMSNKRVSNSEELQIISEEKEVCNESQDEKEVKAGVSESIESEKTIALNTFLDKIQKEEKKAPYSHLAENGVISYNGVQFVCDNENQSLCLGDVSNPGDTLIIPLSNGGCLMVNRNQIGSLSLALGMFSAEDVGRIMRAIAQDNQCRRKQEEIETFKDSADGVEEAWRQAAQETGCDGFGYDEQGKKTHITQLDIARLLSDKDESVFGNTVESALDFAKRALERLKNPLQGEADSEAVKAAKKDEKRFYEVFIEKLEALL